MKNDIIIGILQPSYLAWIPLFKRMIMSDIFIYLDDVKYSKNSFHNRNRIKTPQGSLTLTVPVLYKGNSSRSIQQMPISNSTKWKSKHWRAIELNYSKTNFFKQLSLILKNNVYSQSWEYLADLNIKIIELFKDYLGITTKCYRSSELNIKSSGNEKLIDICKYFNANKFIVKSGTEHYHPKEIFLEHNIEFEYFLNTPESYNQIYGDFIADLSILDFAMNCGPNSFNGEGINYEDWQYRFIKRSHDYSRDRE